jgi:glycosyltransferase involved in cell wall biosynthesis
MDVDRVSVCGSWNAAAKRLWYEHVRVPQVAIRLKLDLVHTMNYFGPVSLPCPSIVNILDMNYRAVPKTFTTSRRLARAMLTSLACDRAAAVVTLSEFSKGEIERYLAPRAPVFSLHLGPAPELLAAQATWPRELPSERAYLLSVGTSFAHKNLHGLVEAYDLYCAKARARDLEPSALYLVGLPWRGTRALTEAIVRSPNKADIRVLGPIPAAHLKALYQRAVGFVFPSLYEGFGIPPLEAMALGCPVVCSNAASLPEVVGDAVLSVDARDHEQLAGAMCKLHSDEVRRDLVARGKAHVARFSWEETARRLLDIYAQVANRALEPQQETIRLETAEYECR